MLICAPVDDNLCEEIKQYLERARGDHYKSHNTINIICLNHNLITYRDIHLTFIHHTFQLSHKSLPFPFFITLNFTSNIYSVDSTVIQTEC